MTLHPYPDDQLLRQRLRERSRYIAFNEPALTARFMQSACELGHILRAGREYLEGMPATEVDLSTQWLWEQGLVLPEEVDTGRVWRVLHALTNALALQGAHDSTTRLMRQINVVQMLIMTTEGQTRQGGE